MNKNITIVTGLWDIGREKIDGWARREFSHYKTNFFELLNSDAQMCIWIPKELEQEVKEARGDKPTRIYIKEIEDFKLYDPFFNKRQEIRQSEDWLSLAGWLRESPKAQLEYYNPIVFTKFFLLNDASLFNPFNSEYFFWIDGGITNTVNKGYFSHDKVLDNLQNYLEEVNSNFLNITFPYTPDREVHGFKKEEMAEFCKTDNVEFVARGGFFGGRKNAINDLNNRYYRAMEKTIDRNLMGTEECIFTILCYTYPETIHQFSIESNGLVWPFFEKLKDYNKRSSAAYLPVDESLQGSALYVLTFNSPKQFHTLIQSMEQYDIDLAKKTKKYLIDNSTDTNTLSEYIELCKTYNFEHIKKDNVGICGGRQFAAEHFDSTTNRYMLFFEDDMFFYSGRDQLCKNGFTRYTDNLLKKIENIMDLELYDFLKISFTEFYGDNSTQWAWYNVPQDIRDQYWPDYSKLPEFGLDPNSPKTKFSSIKVCDGIPYAEGEIYYCNWPQIVSKRGNKKMFLDTKWAHPFEQTWMSHIFQLTKQEIIKSGILLASPIEHNRLVHYEGSLRKES